MGNSLRLLSPICSMGDGPTSSQGAMSAREAYACDMKGRLPGETAGSLERLRKQMSALVSV
jgi:hypothetical protein